MKTADLYLRVSTDEQASKGFSLRSQEERLRKYCALNDIEIKRTITEDYSAKTFRRPAWINAANEWNQIKSKRPNLLLFTNWNRFSRNAGDAYYMIHKLTRLGIEPYAIDQPLNFDVPENKMMLAIYLASSEVENDRRALNVRHGMHKARKEGRWPAHAPKGYINTTTPSGKKIIMPNEPDASIMQHAFMLIAVEKSSIYHAFRQCVSQGLKCSKSHFFRLLRNPIYCGKIIVPAFDKEKAYIVTGEHKKIISESTFNEVQKIINNNKGHRLRKTLPGDSFLLRGFILCPLCNKTLTGSASKGRLKLYYYYHCSSGCNFRVRADKLNNKVLESINDLVPLQPYSDVYKEIMDDLYRDVYEKKVIGQAQTIKSMEQIIDRVIKARDSLYSGGIDAEDFTAIKENCEKKINELGIQLQSITTLKLTKDDKLNKCYKSLYKLGTIYAKAELAIKRQLVQILFAGKVVVNDCIENMFNLSTRFIFNLDTSTHALNTLDIFEQSDLGDEIKYIEKVNNRLKTTNMSIMGPDIILPIVRVLQSLALINIRIA